MLRLLASVPAWRRRTPLGGLIPARRRSALAVVLALALAPAARSADPESEARALIQAGRPGQAFARLVEAVRADPAAAANLQATALDAYQGLLERVRNLQASQAYEEALGVFRVVWPAIIDEAAAAPLFVSRADYAVARQRLYEILNAVTLSQAKLLLSQGNLAQALQNAQFCIEYQPEERNPEARMLKAEILDRMGETTQALDTLKDLLNRLPAGEAWLRVREKIQDMENRARGGASPTPSPGSVGAPVRPSASPVVAVTASPSPTVVPTLPPRTPVALTPVPGPPVARTPPRTPAAPPAATGMGEGSPAAPAAPSPTPALSVVSVWEKARDVVPAKYRGMWGYMVNRVGSSDVLPWVIRILVILGVVALLWVPWYRIVRLLANRGSIRASLWQRHVKRFGVVAFVVFLIMGIKLKKPERRRRCPYCRKPVDDIESYASLNFYVCPNCNQNIKPVYDLRDYIKHLGETVERIMSRQSGAGRIATPLERDAMAKLVRSVLTLAVRQRATDLHLESEADGLKVRSRCDGMMTDFLHFPKGVAAPLLSAIKIQANLDITQHAVPQDGKIKAWIDNTDIDIRLNSSPSLRGDNISMRLLDRRLISIDSTKLGLEGRNLEHFERTIRKPHGLVLVTGPSGSGKSTTLYVALNTINTGDRNIITIEDPIEYELKGLKQLQVNVAQNFTFATGLRSILRQDPDVIMVGEVRDKETAEIALDAAMTGHLVFTTLHTIDAATAIARLHDLGIEPRRYAAALDLVIAQRLIRILCSECKKPRKPAQKDLDQLGILPVKDQIFLRGAGCQPCNGTGFYGRTGIFEVLFPSEEIKEILETNVAPSVIRELARKDGMRTLREEGVAKVLLGITSVEEVIRVTM